MNVTIDNYTNVSTVENNTEQFVYHFYQTEQIVFLSALFVFIVTGNVVVLTVIILNRKKRTRMHLFIANLACADLSVGVFFVLTEITWKSTVFWYAGTVMCKIVKFAQVTAVYGSTYALVSLSIDRVTVIAFPMHRFGKGYHHRFLIGGSWFFSVLFSSPLLFTFSTEKKFGVEQCVINLPSKTAWRIYFTLNSFAVFVIPAIIIALCYILIVVTIWKRSKFKVSGTSDERTNLDDSDSQTPKSRAASTNGFRHTGNKAVSSNVNSRHLIMKAKIKTIKMTFVIVLAFILCWSPYFMFDILALYGHLNKSQQVIAMGVFVQSLAPLNSAANPIIFLLFNFNQCKQLWKTSKQKQYFSATVESHF